MEVAQMKSEDGYDGEDQSEMMMILKLPRRCLPTFAKKMCCPCFWIQCYAALPHCLLRRMTFRHITRGSLHRSN